MAKLSPMMQQYFNIKDEHKNCILFFRLGDFYEMFFEDAITISKELELTLTARDCGLEDKAPMCGIPYHASEAYIKRLIEKGHKVAICEQTSAPTGKGIVQREVVRIVTPGTVIENSLLNEDKNNYIASIIVDSEVGDTFAVCFADISTGDTHLTQKKSTNICNDIINELSKFMPTEILINDEVLNLKEVGAFAKDKLECTCELVTKDDIIQSVVISEILNHFKGKTLDELGIVDMHLSIKAVGTLLKYVRQNQKDGALRIVDISIYTEHEFMDIDLTARRNLEITQQMNNFDGKKSSKKGTLLSVLDVTKTAMGKRYIRKALEQPLMNLAEITKRQVAIKEFLDNKFIADEITANLSSVYDIERLMTRVIYGTANPRDVLSLANTATNMPQLKELVSGCSCRYLKDIYNNLDTLEDIQELILSSIKTSDLPNSIKDGGVIEDGVDSDLDELRSISNNAKSFMAKMEIEEKEKTGIGKLKIGYNRVFGYYIEVTKANAALVPDTYIRKQTLTNCERYITEELKQLEEKVLSANDKIIALECALFEGIIKFIVSNIDRIQKTSRAIARLDFILSLTNVAYENRYVCPIITNDGTIDIKDGRHPVVETLLKETLFVPNDTLLDCKDNKMMVLTGPNMAGKSTFMRQVAIITVMAQIGSYVPASNATIGLCDKIFTRVGAYDDLSAGQSTFMVEMSEVAHILKNATPKSLVILDEIGRGTSTFDGMSIAKAVVNYMMKNKKISCKALFATHYHELTSLEDELNGVKNYNIVAKKKNDNISFLRKIVRGGADDSYGIEVAQLAGVPLPVVADAKKILAHLEANAVKFDASKEVVEIPEIELNQVTFVENGSNPHGFNLSNNESNIRKRLENMQLDTMTLIEAMNELHELKKML